MARGKCGDPDRDGRKRFQKGERSQLTLKIDPALDRAFRWLADQYGKPFNETFEDLVKRAVASLGKDLAAPEFN